MSLPASLMDSRRGGPPSPLLLQTRTVSETDAIFDEILSQIKDASRVLDGRVESPDYDRLPPKLPTIPLKGGREFSSRGASLDERLGQMDLPRRRLHTSCSSSSDIDGPGALMRRLSGRRKPPFLEEMLAGRHSPSSEVSEKLAWRPPHGRKFLAPDRKSSPVPNILTSSGSDSFPLSATSAHVNFDLLHQLSVLPDKPRLSACSDEFSDVAVSDLEPATKALKLMVCVSRNKECLSTLVSYLCLPKFMDKIATLAKCPVTPPKALGYIATLLTNIFEVGGSDGRKTAMGSGFLELIIKLLHTRDPIPGTCLSLLNNLLANDDDNDHLQKIIRVPSEPLLMYLEPIEMSGSDADSGIGSRHLSRITPSGSDNQMYSSDSSRPNSGIGAGGSHLDFRLPPGGLGGPSSPSGSRPGTGSFVSDISDSTSALSLVSPTLKGPPISLTDARCIVLKMLSVSSCHRKMQRGLAKPHSVTLLSGCLGDVSQENVTNAVITLANMAQNVDSHNTLREAGIVAKLQDLLGNDPRQSFHVTRGLVYMGELALPANNLFSESGSSWETDFVVLSRDEDDGHSYARGATIEKCVEFLTESVSHLWGGFSLKSGPHSPGNELAKRATKQQIATFFLTCYQSFMHPLILIRLLLHRLAMPCSQNPFDWSVNPDKTSVPSFAHTDSIPAHQSATLKVIGRWLEDFSDDFVQHLELNEEVSKIVQRLKLARGPYTTHCHRLRSLQHDVTRPRSNTLRTRQRMERLPPHHSNLYTMLKKVILTGLLPVTLDEAIYLTALQMHIEMVAEPSPFIGRPSVRGNSGLHRSPSKVKKSFTGKLKSTLPSGYTKSKPLMKRVRALMQDVEMLSERNSKHSFIERCQALPGYECTLYPVRVPQGARFRKEAKQILGVGSKKIVFLDEKTKELVSSYSMEQIGSVSVEEDPCSLVLVPVEGGPVRFHVETSRMAWDIKNMIQRGKDGEDVQPVEEVVRWSESTSMASSTTPPSIPPPSPSRSSSTSSDDNPSSRETSPSPSSDKPTPQETDVGPQGTTSGPKTTTISPGVVPTLTNSSPAHVQNGHVRSDSYDITEQSACEENRSVSFCNCPPDPEIPRHIKLYQLSVGDVLKCPLEIARQMTLIAHEHFGRISSIELLQKVHLIPKTKSPSLPSSLPPSYTTSLPRPSKRAHIQQLEIDTRPQTAVERLAYRFNQVGNWVASTILTFDELEQRVDALEQFILIAKHCLDLRNYSSMMAIIMAGLGSAPIRRLHRTWEGVSKVHMEMFKQMDTILESKSNYKNYRDKLSITPVPAVPYIGVFLKDLTFIADGNPDYIRGGLVNLHKRRQVYQKLEEITHFQQEHYNYHTVPELQAYLLGFHPIPDEELHSKSNILEPRIRRSQSHNSTRAKSTSSSTSSFFKALTRSTSSSSTNLHRTS